ncbi:bifunctional aminoglycoside phosphotransferase/ATP-binding protein [Pelagibius sp.]|uniref:bifunctional aminoglycoside phosphotransferase/ATP-binding protein n=1 Tax=Pelagibius sp. TaxID=1931238 RepID=UPI00262D4E6A|nr:bifunctional aminoglycoside phosphotransferase/ATP-binding protein [Pelagibius sp.]
MTAAETADSAPPQGPAADPQEAAQGFLGNPRSFGPGVAEVQRIDTHGAIVFLAGDRAYKIKRAVRYPYMDFSTLEKRRRALERELSLNVRTAPCLYLRVSPLTREADGHLALDGTGTVVEWVLVMKRFSQGQLFDRLAEAGELSDATMLALADAVAVFHDAAPAVDTLSAAKLLRGAEAMEWVVEENNEEILARPDLFAPAEAALLAERSRAALERSRGLLDRRSSEGRQRLCHGDLHLRNVVLLNGRPTLFDAIEFNDSLACIDVLYDLAFLLMDLEERGFKPFANLVLNRYLQRRGDLDALALLPLFLSARAAVRAKVAASLEGVEQSPEAKARRRAEAAAYFAQALRFLKPPAPRLVAVGGLSGTGKTSLARRLAVDLGPSPGAVHLRSDVLRKALAGVEEHERLPPDAYDQASNDAVYRQLLDRAQRVLTAGHAVVVDAVFAQPAERAAVRALAETCGVAFCGLWLQAQPATMMTRVDQRHGDASDATAAVVQRQLSYDIGVVDWQVVETDGPLDRITDNARIALGITA